MRADRLPRVQLDYIVPKGGLDLVTAPMRRTPGSCRAAENFECELEGGYTRVRGYSRFAGQPNKEKLQFYDATIRAAFTGSSTDMGVYSSCMVYGKTSGATGRVLYKITSSNVSMYTKFLVVDRMYTQLAAWIQDSYPSLTADIRLYDVSGAFVADEELGVMGENGEPSPYGFPVDFDGTVSLEGAPTLITGSSPEDLALIRYYCSIALNFEIGPVDVGWGIDDTLILGVVDTPFGLRVFSRFFDASGSSYYVKVSKLAEVTYNRNYWAWTSVSATWSVDPAAPAQPEVPQYLERVQYNFSGAAGEEKVYGVTGAGQLFCLTPSTDTIDFLPTGMAVDKPEHVAAHKNRLFLSFGGSLQFSTAGDPTDWSPVTGAGELAVGEQIIRLQSVVGGDSSVLLVYTTSRIYGLYGDKDTDFNLVLLASEIHVEPDSIQMLDRPVFVTDYGLTTLSASDTFGNFQSSTLSRHVAPYLSEKRRTIVSSVVVRSKNQYRIFFDDGSGLYCTFDNGKLVGIMPVRLPVAPNTFLTYVDDEANEDITLFATPTEPFVFRMDNGNDFYASPINYSLFLSFSNSKGARVNKSYRKAALEIQAEGEFVAFEASADLDYASMGTAPTPFVDIENPGQNLFSNWDEALWDEFVWDGYNLTPAELSLDGTGENISIVVKGSSYLVSPFTLSGVTLQYITRRLKR